MKSVRLLCVYFLYTTIYVKTETVVEKTTLKESIQNASTTSTRPVNTTQEIKHTTEKEPEEPSVIDDTKKSSESPAAPKDLSKSNITNIEEHTPEPSTARSNDVQGRRSFSFSSLKLDKNDDFSSQNQSLKSGKDIQDIGDFTSDIERPALKFGNIAGMDKSSVWPYQPYATEKSEYLEEVVTPQLLNIPSQTDFPSSEPVSTTETSYHKLLAFPVESAQQTISPLTFTARKQASAPQPSSSFLSLFKSSNTLGYGRSKDMEGTPCKNGNAVEKILTRILIILLENMKSDSTKIDTINQVLDTLESQLQSGGLQNANLYPKLQSFEEALRLGYSPKSDLDSETRTKMMFKNHAPKLEQPGCNTAFLKLMAIAYESYVQLSKYPNCKKSDNPLVASLYSDKDNKDFSNKFSLHEDFSFRPDTSFSLKPKEILPSIAYLNKRESQADKPMLRSTNQAKIDNDWNEISKKNLYGTRGSPKTVKNLIDDIIYAPEKKLAGNTEYVKKLLQNYRPGQKLVIPLVEKADKINPHVKLTSKWDSLFMQENLAQDVTHSPVHQSYGNPIYKRIFNNNLQLHKVGFQKPDLQPELNTVRSILRPRNLNLAPIDISQVLSSLQRDNQSVQKQNSYSLRTDWTNTNYQDSTTSSAQLMSLLNPAGKQEKPPLDSSFAQRSYQELISVPWQKTAPIRSSILSRSKRPLSLPLNVHQTLPTPSVARISSSDRFPITLISPDDLDDPNSSLTQNSPNDLFGNAPEDFFPQNNLELDSLDQMPIPEFKPAKHHGHVVNIFLEPQYNDFSDKQKKYLVQLLRYFRILLPGGEISTQNEELLKLIIIYLKAVLRKLDGIENKPSDILPPESDEFINAFRDKIEKRFLLRIIHLVQAWIPNPKDRQIVFEKIRDQINTMQKLDVDLSNINNINKILDYVKYIISQMYDTSTPETEEFPPGVDPTFIKHLYELLNDVGESEKQYIIEKLEDFINELVRLGYDLRDQEVIKQMYSFLDKLMAQLDLPTEPSDITPEKLDPKFLAFIYKLITSSADPSQREVMLSQVRDLIKDMIRQGVDLTKKDNLEVILHFVGELLTMGSKPGPDDNDLPSPQIDQEFTKNIHEYIRTSVPSHKIDFVKRKLADYIEYLIENGVDVSKTETLGYIVKYINEVIEQINNSPPSPPRADDDDEEIATEKVISPELIARIQRLVSSSPLSRSDQQKAWVKIKSYIDNLTSQGMNTSEHEILSFVIDIIKSMSKSKKIDEQFLRKLYRYITESVPISRQGTVIENVERYIKDLMRKGIDLTLEKNLKPILSYVEKLIDSAKERIIATLPPPPRINPKFLENLYKYIEASVNTIQQKEFVKMQLQNYIQQLTIHGVDFNNPNTLQLLTMFVEKVIKKYTMLPPDNDDVYPTSTVPTFPREKEPSIDRGILNYAYKYIYKLLVDATQRSMAIKYLHEYIKWAEKHNFNLDVRENIYQLIRCLISLVTKHDSFIFNTSPNYRDDAPLSPKSVEVTYTLTTKMKLEGPGKPEVKYTLPYNTFVDNLKDILLRQPSLRSNRRKFELDLSAKSTITQVSPELQKISKPQLIKLISRDGAFVAAKIPHDENSPLRSADSSADFDKMIEGLDAIVNRNVDDYNLTDVNDLRKDNDEKAVADTDDLKHFLVIQKLPSFDPIPYLASSPFRRSGTDYEETKTAVEKASIAGANVNSSGSESLPEQGNLNNTAKPYFIRR